MSKTVTEFGVKYTWPDGHTEVQREDDRVKADANARMRNSVQRTVGGAVAQVVVREVTFTDWRVTS